MAEAMLSDPALADDPGVNPGSSRVRNDMSASTCTSSGGRCTHFVEQEGKDLGIGEEGTYAYLDDHTIAFQSSHLARHSGVTGFALLGDKLTWKASRTRMAPGTALRRESSLRPAHRPGNPDMPGGSSGLYRSRSARQWEPVDQPSHRRRSPRTPPSATH